MSLEFPLEARRSSPAAQADAAYRVALTGAVEARLRRALDACPPGAGLISVSLSLPELGALLRPWPGPSDMVCWADANTGRRRVAMGAAAHTEPDGLYRLSAMDRELDALRGCWLRLEPDGVSLPAEGFVGFGFAPCATDRSRPPSARLVIPQLLAEWTTQGCVIAFSARRARASEPAELARGWVRGLRRWLTPSPAPAMPPEVSPDPRPVSTTLDRTAWGVRVEQALGHIAAGRVEKLVLARGLRVRARRAFDLRGLWSRLEARYPSCVRFAVKGPGGWLVGASPERLVALEGGWLRADALAGTARRHADMAQDRGQGEGLLTDPKMVHEHRLVVRALESALAPLCADFDRPPSPQVRTLSNVHHLWTPLSGRLQGHASLLGLAGRIYPTPSVSGWPMAEACRWISEHEGLDRGWYTGAIGWVEGDGGVLDMVLRSALITGAEAQLYAGAGIVAGSDPDQEFDETEWKLKAMLDALAHA